MGGIAEDTGWRGFSAAAGQGTSNHDNEQDEIHDRQTACRRDSLPGKMLRFLVAIGRTEVHLVAAVMEINGRKRTLEL